MAQVSTSDAMILSRLISVVGESCFEERMRSSLDQWNLADHFTFLSVEPRANEPVSLMTGTFGGGSLVARLTERYVRGYFSQDPMANELLAQSDDVSLLHRSVTAAPSHYHRIFFATSGVLEKASVACRLDGRIVLASFYATQVKHGFDRGDLARILDLCPILSSLVLRHFELTCRNRTDRPFAAGSLSRKEREVCQRMLQGCTSEAIALQLDIATSTVLTHRKSIYRKLGIVSQAQLFHLFADLTVNWTE